MNHRLTALASLGLALALTLTFVSCSDSKDSGGSTAPLSFVDGIATGTPDAAHPPQKDNENPLPWRVEIADYKIIVVWEQDGAQLATNTALINNVAPGLTSSFEVSAPGDGTLRTTCRVQRVDRTPSG